MEEGLNNNKSLIELDLSHNAISTKGWLNFPNFLFTLIEQWLFQNF